MKTARITSSQERNRKAKSIRERVTKFAKTRGVKVGSPSVLTHGVKSSLKTNTMGKMSRAASLQPKLMGSRVPVVSKASGRLPTSGLPVLRTSSRSPSTHLTIRK